MYNLRIMKKSAIEKINIDNDLPKIKEAPIIWGGGSMLIPHPKEVLQVIHMIPYGKILTLDEIRIKLAKKHHVDITCPMTTGIFVLLAAQAHDEDSIHVSYWRILKKNGELNSKFPGGIETHKKNLIIEGHTMHSKANRLFLKNYQDKLYHE